MSSLCKQQIHHLNPLAAVTLHDRDLWRLGREALNSHVWALGAPGVGKTAVTVDAILWPLFYQGRPCLVMDPVGALSRRLVWRICHYPRYLQPYLFQRLVYVARGASDCVMRTPLYAAKEAQASHYDTASRLIQVIARADPFLVTASVEGMNSLREAGIYGGQMASALGLQVTEVADMLHRPHTWLPRLAQVTQEQPLLRPAFAYFNQLKDASPALQSRKTFSFLNHVLAFLSDPMMRAPYAASGPGLDLDAHVRRGDTIIFDYSYLTDRDSRQFAMLWDFLAIAEWAKRRGIGGRERPCLWCIDEVSALTNLHALEHSILGEDINEIATQYARNVGLQLCFISQGVNQLPPAIVTALSQFGTKLVGNLPLLDDALSMAKLLYAYDPHRVRKTETVWANDPIPEYHATSLTSTSIFARANYIPLDARTTEYTIDESYQVVAQAIRQLPKFHFLVKAAAGEGDLTGEVRHVTFERLINGHFPDPAALEQPLALLRAKWGVPIEVLLRDIEQRPQQTLTVRPVKGKTADGILEGDRSHAHALPTNRGKNKRRPTRPQAQAKPRPEGSRAEPADEDPAWQAGFWTEQETEQT